MSSATEREPQEYLWLPFGTYRGKPFPEVPRDFLERIMTKWNADPVNEQYPGLMDSISDFLKGSGYYFGQDTYEKSRKRSDAAWKASQEQKQGHTHYYADPPRGNPWQGAKTYSAHDPPEPKSSSWSDFDDLFEKTRQWNQKYGQQREHYDPPQTPRKSKGVNKDLAKQIIAAGRRAMATKHHPDKGGDVETMQEVNAAADWLETLL